MANSMITGPFGPLVHGLIGCDWGRLIAIPADMKPCEHQAVQRIVFHQPDGGQFMVKLCDSHYDVAVAESDPRGEVSTDAA